ncbi:MAG: ATP-dependent protease ATPase subunit HslU [bacterium]|nr:ATP-dependent protease ATPase subunit HslU [bacterium]
MGQMLEDLTPRQIVRELDRYIVGQDKAKRCVAIALRNRFRRRRLDPELQEEVVPKNILMIGPTGVGKTEIARRLAKLVAAPFVKVEATRFTEVGYVGRDVEGMVRDLVETAIRMVKEERVALVREEARRAAQARLLDILAPLPKKEAPYRNPLEMLLGGAQSRSREDEDQEFEETLRRARLDRAEMLRRLEAGALEDESVEIEVEDASPPVVDVLSGAGLEEMSINFQDILGGMLPRKKKRRKVSVREAREVLTQEEAAKLVDMEKVRADAVSRAEQSGIVFLDEIDKVAGKEQTVGPDVSREGVQRDILPIVEGSTVITKYGPVRTDHMLFIAAGAFHQAKPSDLIPELQGRLPIRVELESLGTEDFCRILTEPQNALVKQYEALLATDGVRISFTADGIREIARMASLVNQQTEDIGARRLHTLMEKVLEDVSFETPDTRQGNVIIDSEYVNHKLADIIRDQDLSRYIL